VTKPSDFAPERAIEVRSEDSRDVIRRVWILRFVGGGLLLAGWLAVAVLLARSLAEFGIVSAVFAALGCYAFTAAAVARRISVDVEKKLRLALLVHNIELENMAMRDDLTQLFSRRHFFERIERELETARGFDRPLSIILIDLDGLKAVNDAYGHLAGDKALAGFGRFLLNQTRGSDVPARIGGDEFAIILPDTSENAAQVAVRRLTEALATADLIDDDDLVLHLTASVGVGGYPWGGDTVDAIIQQADASMYADKRARRTERAGVHLERPGNGTVPALFRKNGESQTTAE
jgi:diguanylate cyclase (GGDEF)-like protein